MRKRSVNCRVGYPRWLIRSFPKYSTSRPENHRPPWRTQGGSLLSEGPRGTEGQQLSYFLLPSPCTPPPPPPSILGWLRLQECDGISANRQSVPRGAGAAPRRPHSPSHSKHKGLSSLSAWLSSSGDSLPTGDSPQCDKPLGPLLAVLLGLQPGCPGIGILELAWLGA